MITADRRPSRAARRSIIAAAVLTAVAVTIAACGGSSSSSGSPYAAAKKPTPAAKTSGGTSVALASSKLGRILVDNQGRTLYLFEADKGAMSACDSACASVWPPLTTTGKPAAASGVSAAMLGTTKRGDGTSQVTYNGHPLYTFAGDGGAGQTSGQGLDDFGAEWYVLSGAGQKIEKAG